MRYKRKERQIENTVNEISSGIMRIKRLNFLTSDKSKNMEDKKGFYTLSEQDVIILEEVTEEVTDKTIVKIKNDYEPNTCDIRTIEQVQQRFSANFEFRVSGV